MSAIPSETSPVRLGWIGLGNMGIGMARNIQKHIASSSTDPPIPPLKVYNRTAPRCGGVVELGGVACQSVAEIVEGCDVVFLSRLNNTHTRQLSDDAAVLGMVEQLIAASSACTTPSESSSPSSTRSPSLQGKMIIDTTTVHPDTTTAMEKTLVSHGALFAAMPVFGPAPVAAAGQLIAGFAGPNVVLDTISPFLKGVIAREVMVVGDKAEMAVLLKTTSNLLTATLTLAIAEAHVFASKTGLPASTLERLLKLNLGPYAHLTSQRMTSGVYCPGHGKAPWSDLDLALKDVGHGVDTAEKRGVVLHAGQATMEALKGAKDWARRNGDRRLDSSSLFGAVREENGLEFESEVVRERDGKLARESGGQSSSS